MKNSLRQSKFFSHPFVHKAYIQFILVYYSLCVYSLLTVEENSGGDEHRENAVIQIKISHPLVTKPPRCCGKLWPDQRWTATPPQLNLLSLTELREGGRDLSHFHLKHIPV